MARRRKTRRAPRLPSLPKIRLPGWPVWRGLLRAAVWPAAAGAVSAAWVFGVPRLEAYASAHQGAGTVAVRLLRVPPWAQGDLEDELVAIAAREVSRDPLNRDGLVAARQALLATGWFEEIRQVRRASTWLVEIDGRFALPFALVRDGAGGNHLIDRRGCLLPRAYPEGGAPAFAVVTGARLGRPVRYGEAWPGADVAAAIQVLRLIQDRPWRVQIADVDVSRFQSDSSISLRTDRGCVIRFGRAPGAEGGAEVPAERKLKYLDYHYEQYGHVDRGFLRELDVTGDVVIGR